MAKKTKNLKIKSWLNQFFNYLKESKEELKKVSWPTRKETLNYTLIVIIISSIIAVFLGFADFLLTKGLSLLLKK